MSMHGANGPQGMTGNSGPVVRYFKIEFLMNCRP